MQTNLIVMNEAIRIMVIEKTVVMPKTGETKVVIIEPNSEDPTFQSTIMVSYIDFVLLNCLF